MWGAGYFYWVGVVVTALFTIGILFGVGCSLSMIFRDWREEQKFWRERDKRITMTVDRDWKLGDELKEKSEEAKE